MISYRHILVFALVAHMLGLRSVWAAEKGMLVWKDAPCPECEKPMPGTRATDELKRKAANSVFIVDAAERPDCAHRQLVQAFDLGDSSEPGVWQEDWKIDSCGVHFRYRMTFARTADGHGELVEFHTPAGGRITNPTSAHFNGSATTGDRSQTTKRPVSSGLFSKNFLGTLASQTLMTDVAETIVVQERRRNAKCGGSVMDSAQVIQPVQQGRWMERWLVRSCGTPFAYQVVFSSVPGGGTAFWIRYESDAQTTPAPTAQDHQQQSSHAPPKDDQLRKALFGEPNEQLRKSVLGEK